MACLRLLLVASCVLMTAVGSLGAEVFKKTVVTCEQSLNVHLLSCDTGVISVLSSFYGRDDAETCSDGRPASQLTDTDCSLDGTLEIVKSSCNGQTDCELSISDVATGDPCGGTFKYLETVYICVEPTTCVTCEGSELNLKCAIGQVLSIQSANYGRTDMTRCSHNRPSGQVQKVDCTDPADEVADSCDGKQSCTVAATNSVFGDPCGGTYKYLNVSYTCQNHVVACEGSEALLRCALGKSISVITAVYGRSDMTTCSQGRPSSQTQNDNCSDPNDKVADKCNGKRRCRIQATNSVFGDPCAGTFKYLEVTYVCAGIH